MTRQIIIGNSVSQITGLTSTEFASLRKVLSYIPKANRSFFSGRHQGQRKFLLNKRGEFPTGLHHLVREWSLNQPSASKAHAANFWGLDEIDRRRRPKAAHNLKATLSLTPYQEQREAAKIARAKKRGIIVAPTGMGKSVIVALMIEELQVPTLVVVPNLALKDQLAETLTRAYGEQNVGEGKRIWVCNVSGLDTKAVLIGYDAVIIDEFHHSGAKTYLDLNKKSWGSVYYKFGLTATPFRSDENERLLLEGVLSEVIYRVEYKTAVQKGYIVPLEAYTIEVPLTKMRGNESSWPAVYSELVVNNRDRNDLITQLMLRLHRASKNTLILVKEVKHGEILSCQGAFPFAKGEAKDDLELFNTGGVASLIGTLGVVGEGCDTKSAEYLILASSGKSKNQFMQNVGRVLRVFPGKQSGKVILLRDRSHKWLDKHYRECAKILKEEYGVVPVNINLQPEAR